MTEWFETLDESFWLNPDEVGEEEAAYMIRLLDLKPGQSVLDAPCGAGRVAVHLAKAGLRVTGIDIRESFIERAKSRFEQEGVQGTFRVLDLRGMDFPEEFDGAACWSGSFGYFTDEENLDVLRRFARALKPGGRLVVDQVNRERLLRHFEPVREVKGVTVRNEWDADCERLNATYETGGEGNRLSVRLYTPGQMRRLFQLAGLEVESVRGWIGEGEFHRGARRMVMVGVKCPAADAQCPAGSAA